LLKQYFYPDDLLNGILWVPHWQNKWLSRERKYVLVVREGKTAKTDVSTGNAGIDKIEVYEALRAGDKVIENAHDEIKESDK
jgi:hypothetical protein